jgi:hypothetical protein
MGEARNTYGEEDRLIRHFDGEYWEKEPLGRTRHRWKDNITMDLKVVGWGMDWIYVAHNRGRWRVFVNAVMNFRVL